MRLPPALIALDVLGTLILGLGIFAMVSDSARIGAIDLAPLALPLIIAGAFLMAPLLIYLLRQILSGSRG